MDEFLTTILSLVGSAIISGVVGICVKRSLNKYFKDRDELACSRKQSHDQELIEQIREELRSELAPLYENFDSQAKKLDLLNNAMLSCLRDAILRNYYSCRDKNFRTDQDTENMQHLFGDYDDLHGNSFVEDIMNRFMKLPPSN